MIVSKDDLKTMVPEVAERYTQAQLQAVVSAVDRFIKNYCQRNLERARYVQRASCSTDGYIYVNEPPIVEVVELAAYPTAVMSVKNENAKSVTITDTAITLRTMDEEAVSLRAADYTNIAELAEYINANVEGWTAQVVTGYAHVKLTWLLPGFYAPSGAKVVTVSGFTEQLSATVMGTNKIIVTGGVQPGSLLLTYVGGYNPIPDDLKWTAAKLCADYLSFAERMPIQRETIGDITYVYRTLSDLLTDEHLQVLTYYRNVV